MSRSRKDERVAAPEAWEARLTPPPFDFSPLPAAEIFEAFHGGEPEADEWELLLASMARVRGALDVQLAEGLHALRHGHRLAELGCHLDDYAREVLDLGKRSADGLAALGAALRERPVLREALRSGRIRLRAAETILPVASGERETEWVERAAGSSVRELEEAVRRARAGALEPEDDWLRLRTRLDRDERLVVDAALDLAGEVMPGSSRMERLEAIAQEALSDFPGDGEEPRLGASFQRIGPGEEARRATREGEPERWAVLRRAAELDVPDLRFEEAATAAEVDHRLRTVARLRAGWDGLIGYWAYVVKRSRLHARLGFASFRHYVEERLQLPPRAVEQRAALEERVWRSPALQEARRQRVSYEKLRVLARLVESEIAPWIARAKALTCIALRRKVEGELERQVRASGRFGAALPRRIAVVLAAAFQAVRTGAGCLVAAGRCLALLATRFLEVWEPLVQRSRTRSQQVRERDGHECQVPGCSHRGGHSHHVRWRSRLGGNELENQAALCAFHHLYCIHGVGTLRVEGEAPGGLRWILDGEEWKGPGIEA